MNKTAEEILREVFNEWTGKTCSDEQWAEYLAKDSIQLTLTAMHKYRSLPSGVTEQQLDEMAAELKEFDAYFDAIYNNHLDKDAGNLWIAFTDKWNSFKKRLLSAKAFAPVSEWVKCEDGLPDFDTPLLLRAHIDWKKGDDRVIYFVDKLTRQEETLEYGQWAYLLEDKTDFLVSQNPLLKEVCQEYVTHWCSITPPTTK